MHAQGPLAIPGADDHLAEVNFNSILHDIQVGKDLDISHLSVLTSPIDSDLPVLSTSSSSMSHTSTSPSVSDPIDTYSYASSHQTSIPSSYLESRRLSLTPLSITHTPRYASPWSAVEPSASQHPLRRGSLPSHHPDYNTSQHRPLTAPQAHICTQQPNWSDQDDLAQFAYNAYTSPAEEPPLSAYSTFPSTLPSANATGDFLLGPGHFEEPIRSRPSTRGEYPAYIPNCEETIHINTPQQFSVDPAAISAPITLDSPPDVKPSVECADFAQSGEDATNDTSRTLTPSPTSTRRRSSAPERRKASPIIETYKGGIVPPIKRRGKLPKATTELLKTWLYDHAQHPYPTEEEKKRLCAHTGLTFNQVSNWMINARRRILPPRGPNAAFRKPGSPMLSAPPPDSPTCGSVKYQPEQGSPLPTSHSCHPSSYQHPWDPLPVSVSIQHGPVPSPYYSTSALEVHSTSPTDSLHRGSLYGASISDPAPVYGFSGGGNAFNYHGSTDGNILSRSLIDSKPYLQQSYASTIDHESIHAVESI